MNKDKERIDCSPLEFIETLQHYYHFRSTTAQNPRAKRIAGHDDL